MHKIENLRLLSMCSFIMILCLMCIPMTAKADMATYNLNDVYLGSASNEMTGSFVYTYSAGDFENGSGVFTNLYIPWHGADFSDLVITIEPESIEFSLDGNIHDQGLDITLFLLDGDGLSSTSLSSVIDTNRSTYHVEHGGSKKGNIVSGSIDAVAVPEPSLGALLGISLIGLVGAGAVRRFKNKAVDNT